MRIPRTTYYRLSVTPGVVLVLVWVLGLLRSGGAVPTAAVVLTLFLMPVSLYIGAAGVVMTAAARSAGESTEGLTRATGVAFAPAGFGLLVLMGAWIL